MSYIDELNDVQRGAVTTTTGPVMVIAGPGSGKTRVLTYRIAYLLEQGVAPWEILALTFTNKAARGMKERIAQVVGDKANKVWAGTFHSIFAKILRVEAPKIGYPSNFTIYDTDDSKSLLTSIMKGMNLDIKKRYNVNTVRSRISSAKSNLISPAAYAENKELLDKDRANNRQDIVHIYKAYMTRCKTAGAMDFDDLLYQLYVLLHNNPDGVREKYQQKFKYVLVDEFQDTNFLQYQIVRKLIEYDKSDRNICVVGDDAQSIYAFRGATIDNILDFEKDYKPYNIKTFKLEQNYRSTEHIVKAANEVITRNKKQIKKEIWSDKGEGHKIKIIKAISDTEEGRRVVDVILEQKNRYHLSNSEIAILYRTNAQSRVFEEYLRRQNISYRIFGGLSFYQRKEIKDLVAYMRLSVNLADEEALKRVINYPKRGIGKTSIEKIASFANENQISLWESLLQIKLPAKTTATIKEFVKMILSFHKVSETVDAYEAASIIARKSGLQGLLKADKTVEGTGRMDNITALLDGVKDFVENDEVIEEGVEDKSLSTFLQGIALYTDQDKTEDEDNYVTLMSVHAAKGLEFKSVIVGGLEENLFPSFMAMESPDGMDEERRLFYVAITRAEQFLTLTFAKSRYQYGKLRYNNASRFLEEIDRAHIESTSAISSRSLTGEPTRASVKGNFNTIRKRPMMAPMVDPKTFDPSPSANIREGMEVIHLKFGKGKVNKIDGGRDNKIATILFKGIDNPERRIMLKFARLQIVE
jgi:DNA helicase-2/ATP-dependent DNA helicase PcrA